MKFISDVTFPSWSGKSVKPSFGQCQSYRNNDKFNCYLEIQSKTDARISISALNSLILTTFKSNSYLMPYLWPGKSVNPSFRKYQSDRNNNKFNCFLDVQSKTDQRISIDTLNPLTISSIQIHIWCHFSVVVW